MTAGRSHWCDRCDHLSRSVGNSAHFSELVQGLPLGWTFYITGSPPRPGHLCANCTQDFEEFRTRRRT